MTHGGRWAFYQNFSSLALTVGDTQCLEDSEQKDHLMNELFSNAGDCRTAPATLGMLNINVYVYWGSFISRKAN